MKEFTIIEKPNFKLRVTVQQCRVPSDLLNINFIQDTLRDSELEQSSTYNFFLTKDELDLLVNNLRNLHTVE